MYIIRPPPMSTRLAKDSARAVVASEQASAIRASNFRTMCFMVVRLSPSIHLLDVRQLPQITRRERGDVLSKLDNLANEIWKSAERLRGKFVRSL
jgi:hypothetical protein